MIELVINLLSYINNNIVYILCKNMCIIIILICKTNLL